MKIRKAGPKDENHVIGLINKFPSQEIEIDMGAALQAYRQIMSSPELGSVFVAEEQDDIFGVITLSFPFAMRCGGVYSCIEEFIVDERSRGKGLGGKLLKAAMSEAASRGCHEIQVNNPSDVGYPVYLRYGWKNLGRHLKMRL
ncbi:MAG: GNAT family N-acetyltransferase [Spirochaetales bacterium]|jgi:GNAT superfamily N-acetyltransferase|nr:GNAT family N-acetyltransferase [Spirochaetales bacterium]